MTLTSVIIPAQNEENYIRRTLESYTCQNFKREKVPFEMVVVTNGCNPDDDTATIAEDLGARVINLEEGNVSKARNRGVTEASGEILLFNDADTVVACNYIERINEAIKKSYDYGVARAKADKISPSALTYALMLNFGSFVLREACGNMFVKRDPFESVGGFAEELKKGEDTDLSIKLRESGGKYTFLWRTSFKSSSRAVSFRRIFKDSFSYIKLRLTGEIEDQS
ncbi:MAG: glycosyltransferase [Nanoarchaeota archaeon]|nr:glycosyltransferase [Nanoarchaeota archaeon]MBU1622181.1 glycosyltransferase [Nanoarchaeota archaeon]MBU1974730.1 glycosyltransferase [Nanoarchaeota archaeon]